MGGVEGGNWSPELIESSDKDLSVPSVERKGVAAASPTSV